MILHWWAFLVDSCTVAMETLMQKRLLIQLPEQQVAIDNEIKMCQRFQHENLIKLVDHVINEGNQTEALLLFPYYQVSYYGNVIIQH